MANGDIDLSSPGGIIAFIFVGIIAIILLSALFSAWKDMNCSSVIQEKNTCCSDRDFWKGQALAMNATITNCSNLIKAQIDICDSRIQNATQQSEDKNSKCIISINNYKFIFVTYNILLIIFYIPLTFNLSKMYIRPDRAVRVS